MHKWGAYWIETNQICSVENVQTVYVSDTASLPGLLVGFSVQCSDCVHFDPEVIRMYTCPASVPPLFNKASACLKNETLLTVLDL